MYALVNMNFFRGIFMNKEKLSKKSIYELRIIGRDLGVKSPTALKKQELIYAIIERNLNLTEPHFTKRGRPPITTSQTQENLLQKAKVLEKIRLSAIKQIEKVLEKAKTEITKIILDF